MDERITTRWTRIRCGKGRKARWEWVFRAEYRTPILRIAREHRMSELEYTSAKDGMLQMIEQGVIESVRERAQQSEAVLNQPRT